MANERRGKILNFFSSNFPGVAAILIIVFMIIPIPHVVVDILMILNIAATILVLLSVISIPRASDFDSFPRIILFLTLFGLGINVSSTRIILAGDPEGGQSDMVQAFSSIVTSGSLLVGIIIFIILLIVQIVVVTKGATRISEVQARFALDSMSQKFFDVDNRLNSGAITDEEAMRLKDTIRKEIDFYSAMDGASKFVSGNVKAGVAITAFNMIGGFVVGMVMNHMGFVDAAQTYAKLTIGDGLISQLPSIMLSFATGILVTGTKSDDTFDQQLKTNFTRDGYIYIVLGAVLLVMGIVLGWGRPSLMIMLFLFGGTFIFAGIRLSQVNTKKAEKERLEKEKAASQKQVGGSPDDTKDFAPIDQLSLELGYALIPLVDKEKGAELLERITKIRQEANLDMGLLVPKIRILDNMTLDAAEYSFKIRGIEAGRAMIKPGCFMAINAGGVISEIQGERTKDPTFGVDAVWIDESRRQEAEDAGYTVVDPPTIIATHLTEIIRANAAEILGRQEVKAIIDKVEKDNPIVVKEVLETAGMTYGQIERILKNLLEERVSIRNMVPILETLSTFATVLKNQPWTLTEKVREALGLQILKQYADRNGTVHVMALSQEWAEQIASYTVYPADGSRPMVAFNMNIGRMWKKSVSDALAKFQGMNMMPIILCAGTVRQATHVLIENDFPGVVVISDAEAMAAGRKVSLEVIGEISEERLKEEIA